MKELRLIKGAQLLTTSPQFLYSLKSPFAKTQRPFVGRENPP
jgi:hypothetical protein